MRYFRQLFAFLRPYRVWVALAPLMMTVGVIMDLMQPRLTQRIIDQGIANNDMNEVLRSGALMILLAFVGVTFGVLGGVFAVRAAMGYATDIRESLFRKIQSLSFANLDKLETGSLITRLTNDVTQMSDAIQMMLRITIRAPLLLIGSITMATLTAQRLSLIFAVLLPTMVVIIGIVISRAFPRFKIVQKKLDNVNAIVQENLAGMRVVKAFARHGYEIQRFGAGNDALRDATLAAVYVIIAVMPLMMLMVNTGIVLIIWFGGNMVNAGDLEVGALVAFTNYLMMSLFALMMLTMILMRFTRAEASAERVVEVLDEMPVINTSEPGNVPSRQLGKVEFQNVSFQYGEDSAPVLDDVSFVVEPGQTLAILGVTGSGKSTIANLIPRFYDVTHGRVLVDDMDVREWDEKRLRDHISIALQESVLFSGTIRENIRFGNPDATDAEIEQSAEMAQAATFISQLENGYESVVGQRGVNLSGGQRQRLAIARALVRDARILILDDSTSAVDVATERKIQEALASIDLTVILVAQRISAVVNADAIIVIEDGRIVANGPHSELLETSEIYREIYQSQIESVVADVAE